MSWDVVMVKHGVGNGLLLLVSCAAYGFLFINTVFGLSKSKNSPWRHPLLYILASILLG